MIALGKASNGQTNLMDKLQIDAQTITPFPFIHHARIIALNRQSLWERTSLSNQLKPKTLWSNQMKKTPYDKPRKNRDFLLDQVHLVVDSETFDAIEQILSSSSPLPKDTKLKALLEKPVPWE